MGQLIHFPESSEGRPQSNRVMLPGDPQFNAAERLAERQSPAFLTDDVADPDTAPNYAGRLLCLNPEKATRFQCGGFLLGGKLQSAIVTEEAQMVPIQIALKAGVLLDITQSGAITTEHSRLDSIREEETDKKVYFTTTPDGERVIYGTSNPEEQKRLDLQVANGARKLILPEGWDDQEKYLLKVKKDEPQPAAKRSLKAKIKDFFYRQIQKL